MPTDQLASVLLATSVSVPPHSAVACATGAGQFPSAQIGHDIITMFIMLMFSFANWRNWLSISFVILEHLQV